MNKLRALFSRIKVRRAIVVAFITSAATITAALISTGQLTSTATADTSPDREVCLESEQQIKSLKASLEKSISLSTLCDISNDHFARNADTNAAKDSLQMLVRLVRDYEEEKAHYAYKMFRLKKIMLNLPRRNINLRIDGTDKEAYTLIQELLKGIEYFPGPITSDRFDTYLAVKRFQESINTYSPGYFNEENFGIFGNATLNAVMDVYERE